MKKRKHIDRADGICPYADSCFNCPRADCTADAHQFYNEVLSTEDLEKLLGLR